jgi:hypothetical protein
MLPEQIAPSPASTAQPKPPYPCPDEETPLLIEMEME